MAGLLGDEQMLVKGVGPVLSPFGQMPIEQGGGHVVQRPGVTVDGHPPTPTPAVDVIEHQPLQSDRPGRMDRRKREDEPVHGASLRVSHSSSVSVLSSSSRWGGACRSDRSALCARRGSCSCVVRASVVQTPACHPSPVPDAVHNQYYVYSTGHGSSHQIGQQSRRASGTGRAHHPHPLRLGFNLEPCLMCIGAAMALRVDELGDLPGVVTDGPRLRTMLRHLTKTLHPGVLNDCFFNAATAVCVKRVTTIGRALRRHKMCLTCSNARRSSIHLPRLQAARDQADQLHDQCVTAAHKGPQPPLQTIAIATHIADLDQAIR